MGSNSIRALVKGVSSFRGERFGLSCGLLWGAIRVSVGRDSGFRGEGFELSWGAIRAVVGSDSGFRGERNGFCGERFGLS